MSLGEDGIQRMNIIYGQGNDESSISMKAWGSNYHSMANLSDNITKSFCDKHQNLLFCHFRDFFIMLALTIVGILIFYVFIKVINSTTKKNFIKTIHNIAQ